MPSLSSYLYLFPIVHGANKRCITFKSLWFNVKDQETESQMITEKKINFRKQNKMCTFASKQSHDPKENNSNLAIT